MNALIKFLLENLILDFQGDLTPEMIREFLRQDPSGDAKALLDKLNKEGSISEMMITLADCLKEYIHSGINHDVVHSQLRIYSES